MRWTLMATLLACFAATSAAEEKPKRLLLVTHSGGFMHDSILVAEQVLKEIGPKYGFEVTCYRFTGDPDQMVKFKVKEEGKDVEREAPALARYSETFRQRTGERGKPPEEVTKANCGRINKETLAKFDAVVFFTTGNPANSEELKDLLEWVKNGGAFAGTHCATDTLYNSPAYGEMIGAYFRAHPPGIQKVRIRVEDDKHPAAKGFSDGMDYEDEIYIFRDAPYNRDRLHMILSIYPESFKPANAPRGDQDYAISWCREYGKGRVFYTSLGHRREVWRDPKFQEHLMGGLNWAVGRLPGDATPSGKLKKAE